MVVEELATRMAQQGHSVTCYNRGGHHVSGSAFDAEAVSKYKGVRLKTVPTIDKKGLAAVTSSFFAALCSAFGPYDVVHIHAEGPAAFCYVIVLLATQALTNIATAMCADRIYPQFKPKGQIATEEKKAINNRIKDLFTSKIGGIIYDSADTIVISSFLGLTALAIYQNYFYILNAITGLITVVFSACTAGIGNSIVVETKEKNYKDLNKFTFIICWGAGFCAVCLLCLYQPFMELWVGKDLMLSSSAVICFVVYFFVRQLNSLFNTYKDASGMWHEDRFRPLVAALTNLALNLILVQFIGLYGMD